MEKIAVYTRVSSAKQAVDDIISRAKRKMYLLFKVTRLAKKISYFTKMQG